MPQTSRERRREREQREKQLEETVSVCLCLCVVANMVFTSWSVTVNCVHDEVQLQANSDHPQVDSDRLCDVYTHIPAQRNHTEEVRCKIGNQYRSQGGFAVSQPMGERVDGLYGLLYGARLLSNKYAG